MEFGPRALGNRSILGDPSHPGIADRINAQIKYRERWRPFCPSMLDRVAPEILQSQHPSPYMTLTFDVAESWKSRIPEVVHEDGTARAQVVSRDTNYRYYRLLEELEILAKEEVYERKRPYNRYSLAQQDIRLQIDLASLFRNDSRKSDFDRPIRERKGSGAKCTTARGGDRSAAVSAWIGRGRDGTERRISLTAPQGRFLYHLPFPTAAAMPVMEIMRKAGVGEEHKGEIADLVEVLTDLNVIETL